jgi:ribonuclease P protein component
MRLQVMKNDNIDGATCTRIGIVTAKARARCLTHTRPDAVAQKSFRRAVDRNLMRRRLRHVYRTHKELWPERVDIVVIMNASGASFLQVTYANLSSPT